MKYGYKTKLNLPFDDALEKTKEELILQGFAVVTELDVQDILKRKLDVNFTRYAILGACTPAFAYEALNIEKDVGLFLPCNVVIYEEGREVYVSAIAPTVETEIVDKATITAIAQKVETRLQQVITVLSNETE